MKRKLMEILACPIDKYHPLELHVFEEKEEIVERLIVCPKCLRGYPIREEIPEMLPDELRKEAEDLPFLSLFASLSSEDNNAASAILSALNPSSPVTIGFCLIRTQSAKC